MFFKNAFQPKSLLPGPLARRVLLKRALRKRALLAKPFNQPTPTHVRLLPASCFLRPPTRPLPYPYPPSPPHPAPREESRVTRMIKTLNRANCTRFESYEKPSHLILISLLKARVSNSSARCGRCIPGQRSAFAVARSRWLFNKTKCTLQVQSPQIESARC